MDSNSTLRTDDFRCHDLRLVSIDSSRTDEVVLVANDLLSKGLIDGFYINDPAIHDWSFIKQVPGIKRYIFSYNSPPKIPGVVMEYVNHARELTIDLSKTDGDLSGFSELETLGVYWREGVDFSHLEQLQDLSLWGVKKRKTEFSLSLPHKIKRLEIAQSSFSRLTLNSFVDLFEYIGLFYIRNLVSIDGLSSNCGGTHELEMENVSGLFDYSSMQSFKKLACLHIDKCSPINSWDFISEFGMDNLTVTKTKHPDPLLTPNLFSKIKKIYIQGHLSKP